MKTLLQRFEDKYIPEPNTGCWLWTASVGGDGYAQIFAKELYGYPRPCHASRVSFYLATGKMPQNDICHKCDNPICVNPEHLYEGDAAMNINDAVRKGRFPIGLKIHNAKLSDEQVCNIKELHQKGMLQKDIAQMFSIRQCHVSRILSGKRRNYVNI